MRSSLRRVAFAAAMLSAPFVFAQSGCAARGPDLGARMAAVKGAYESLGYKADGPTAAGSVTEGKDARVPLALKKGCYQIVAFAGDGLKGIDVVLDDPAGKPVGQVAKQEGQVSVKQCVAEAATYNLVVKSTGGSGSFLAQPYLSSAGDTSAKPTGDDGTGEVKDCVGEDCPDVDGNYNGGASPCDSPPDISAAASAKGTTKGHAFPPRPSCAFGESPGSVYQMHIEGRHKLVVDVTAKYDVVLALFRGAHDGYLCDSGYEVDCSDDSQGLTTKAHLEAVVNTGDYGLMVTGYDQGDAGDFELKTRLEDAPSLESICATAHPITPGSKNTDALSSEGSNFDSTCAPVQGGETLYKLDLKQRSRVRLALHGSGGESAISVRSKCEDSATERVCAKDWHFDSVAWTGLLDPGAYTVIAESADTTHYASVTLDYDAAPATGGTADADSCKDAKPITVGTFFTADTFQAKADLKASCANEGAADVVYKLDVKAKSRVLISTSEDEGRHVIAIQKTCGDTKGEVVCDQTSVSKPLEATLDPGTYYVVLKGKGIDDFGRAKLNVKLREIGSGAAACKAATKLVSGTPITDTTAALPDKFVSEKCGGPINYQASGDKVYQFTLKEKSKVNLTLKSGTFYNAIMSLRQDCSDPMKNEIACSNTYSKILDRDLDPGTYYVVVDGYGTKAEGSFTIEMTSKPIK